MKDCQGKWGGKQEPRPEGWRTVDLGCPALWMVFSPASLIISATEVCVEWGGTHDLH